MNSRAFTLSLVLIAASGCTIYTPVTVDLRALAEEGHAGVVISTEKPSGPDFGRVRGSARTWLFGNCEAAAQRAIDELAEQAASRGSSMVTQFRFRSKWKWGREPLCRRNFAYALLVVPLFLPVPSSVTVSGVAQ